MCLYPFNFENIDLTLVVVVVVFQEEIFTPVLLKCKEVGREDGTLDVIEETLSYVPEGRGEGSCRNRYTRLVTVHSPTFGIDSSPKSSVPYKDGRERERETVL